MADVEISVQAEGVEDAVGDVPEGDAPDVSGADGDDGGGGRGGGGRGLGVIGLLAGLLAPLEDILEFAGVISSVLRAFIAPIAVLMFRLLAPALRGLISLLPGWYDFVKSNEGLLAQLLTALIPLGVFLPSIVNGLVSGWNWLQGAWEDLKDLPNLARDFADRLPSPGTLAQQLWNKMKALPGMIANKLRDVLPFGGGDGGLLGGLFQNRGETNTSSDDPGLVERGAQTLINISGGLTPFIEQIERSSGIDS